MSDDSERLDAKRFNEFLKLLASTLGNLAVAVIVGAFIVPIAKHEAGSESPPVLWIVSAAISYACALGLTQFQVSEE